MPPPRIIWSIAALLLLCSGCVIHPPQTKSDESLGIGGSLLWGWGGQYWLPTGRLPDFSFAGYGSGERPIPDYAATATVTQFGAIANDDLDDTAAFQAALAQTKAGAIIVPPGRYIISGILRITNSGVVLRGAGTEQTTLFFTKPLDDIEPNLSATTSGRPTSNYSWSGGLIRLEGNLQSKVLTPIISGSIRGTHDFVVEDASMLKAGQTIEVFMTDTPANTLAEHLYLGDAGDISQLKGSTHASLVSKITAIKGNRISLERWLRFDIRPEWKPVVRAFAPTVHDSGVEDLTIAFQETPYLGHFTEVGFNPLAFVNVANCWGRRLKFINPDSGPMVGGVFNTVADTVFESSRPPDKDGQQGHHGIYMGGLGDHLFTGFDIRMKFVHDVSVSHCAGVVVSNGQGEDLSMDFHKRAPYEILYTNVDVGKGTRPWKSGGGAGLGKHAGAYVTFWNLRAVGSFPEPPKDFASWSMTTVGVDFGTVSETNPGGRWREVLASKQIMPVDIHADQVARRIRK
jgi:hypothetical protein